MILAYCVITSSASWHDRAKFNSINSNNYIIDTKINWPKLKEKFRKNNVIGVNEKEPKFSKT